MTSEETSLSVVAIVVALIALITTIGQVIQQYFATADGYRRCQSSVIGRWGKRTRLRWRWGEFRFETLYTTPHIALYRHQWSSAAIPEPPLEGRHWIIGSIDGKKEIDDLISGSEKHSSDHVTWLRFLSAIQWAHKKMLSRLKAGTGSHDKRTKSEVKEMESEYLTVPLVTFEERSWDFMPPDVVKPYARTSVGDIAILARRLGMDWERFDPAEGILRAQGNGYMLTSTLVRSVGTIIQISEMLGVGRQGPWMPWVSAMIPDIELNSKISLIPCAAADKMAFGVLPAVGSDFLHRDFRFNTFDDFQDTVRWFTKVPRSHYLFSRDHFGKMDWNLVVSDLLGMCAPLMYRPDVGCVGVPCPSSLLAFPGVTAAPESFEEFRFQLGHLINQIKPLASSPLSWVFDTYQSLASAQGTSVPSILCEWIYGIDPVDRNHGFLTKVYVAYLQTTSFLSPPNRPGGKSPFFRFLVSSHLRYLIRHLKSIYSAIEDIGTLPTDNFTMSQKYRLGPIISPGSSYSPPQLAMAAYFNCLPGMLDQMETDISKGAIPGGRVPGNAWGREELMAGWVVLIFRAMLWNRCHYLVQGKTIPLQYCGSQLPIYIG